MTKSKTNEIGDSLLKLAQPEPQVFDIRIATDGNWFHEGGLIGRKPLVKLFASVLRRENDGSFWLVTPVERGRITVDDAPFIITAMTVEGSGEEQIISFTTNVDDVVVLSAAHPMVMRCHNGGNDLRPYVEVRDGLEACLSRPVFYELARLAVDGPPHLSKVTHSSTDLPIDESGKTADATIGVWSDGTFSVLATGSE